MNYRFVPSRGDGCGQLYYLPPVKFQPWQRRKARRSLLPIAAAKLWRRFLDISIIRQARESSGNMTLLSLKIFSFPDSTNK